MKLKTDPVFLVDLFFICNYNENGANCAYIDNDSEGCVDKSSMQIKEDVDQTPACRNRYTGPAFNADKRRR